MLKGEKLLKQRFCTNCGNELEEHSGFCSNCGAPLQQVSQLSGHISATSEAQPIRKNYKWLGIVLITAIIIFTVFSMQKDNPEKVANTFLEHMVKFDINEAYDMIGFTADTYFRQDFNMAKEFITNNSTQAFYDDLEQFKKDGYVFETFQVTETKTFEKDNIRLYGELKLENNRNVKGFVELVKEKGKWMIADSDIVNYIWD